MVVITAEPVAVPTSTVEDKDISEVSSPRSGMGYIPTGLTDTGKSKLTDTGKSTQSLGKSAPF